MEASAATPPSNLSRPTARRFKASRAPKPRQPAAQLSYTITTATPRQQCRYGELEFQNSVMLRPYHGDASITLQKEHHGNIME